MAKNVTVAGASYTDVPSVELPITGGGTAAFYDASSVTYSLTGGAYTNVSPTNAVIGEGFGLKLEVPSGYSLSGVTVTMGGTDITSSVFAYDESGGSSATLGTKSITANGTYTATDDSLDGYSEVTVNVSSSSPTLQSKSVSYTPTTSSQSATVTADSGYDGLSSVSVSVDAIPSSYIVPSGSLSVTANGTYDVTDYASAVVNVSSSGSSSWTKVAETSYTVSTTSTSAATVATWATGDTSIWDSSKIIYIRIRDTAGKRAGYFYGSDNFYLNYVAANSSTSSSFGVGIRNVHRYTSDSVFASSGYAATSGYGVFADYIYNTGKIRVRQRYNATNSLTIDGTYKVEVYILETPDGTSPFA